MKLGFKKLGKMFQALFDNFHHFGHFCQKLSKMALFRLKWPKMEVFRFFSRTTPQNFKIFRSKHSLFSRKNDVFTFLWTFKKSCSKWALKRLFLLNFSHFDRFFCVFLCIPMSCTRLQWKNLRKMPRQHFMTRYVLKIGQK